ncbi:ankyrin repeat domain-containing protein [Formosa sp. 4Alg 33]|uniref:ankyrin repeat domain-containing protein n=1 Tax=Formosa sp. 4Alg 33 TaxID=3382189 RepID=UPI003D9C4A1C
MKKSLLIIAIALGTVSSTIYASNSHTRIETHRLESSVVKPELNVLCMSIAKGDTEIVKKLIANGEDVNKKSNGLTPTMYAAKYNRTEILLLLIANGANVKTKCNKGYTALTYAKATNAKEAQTILEGVLAK